MPEQNTSPIVLFPWKEEPAARIRLFLNDHQSWMKDGQALRYLASLCTLTIRLFLRHVTYSLASLRSTAIVSTNIDIQVYPTALCSSLQSGPIQGINGGSGTTYPECLLSPVWRLSQSV